MKQSLSVLLCLVMLFSVLSLTGCDKTNTDNKNNTDTSGSDATQASVEFTTPKNMENGTILHCFSWDFNTIKNSMEDIAAAGYSAIQTSPINECLVGESGGMQLYGSGKWYYHYQPTDWTIGNYQLGTRDEFKTMCDTAHNYGIKVLVDVLPNHTTPAKGEINQNLLDAVGGIENLYHQNSNKDITNWGNRLQSTTYNMGGLPDVNTENPDFQEYFFKYINDCIDCGADGFRYDTAKHVGLPSDEKEDDGYENNFWQRAVTDVKNAETLFIYGEVLQGENDKIEEYIETIGRTTASSYGGKLRSAVSGRTLSASTLKGYAIGSAPPNVVTWVESHDNYINDGSYAQIDDNDVVAAWSVIAARKDGTPLFFSRPYGATDVNSWGTMNRIGVSGSYLYKDPRVVAVNRFRTAMEGQDESMYNPVDGDTSLLAIERGGKGLVLINLDGEKDLKFETGLQDGQYTDRISNTLTFTVKDGVLTSNATLGEDTIVVLYNEGYVEYSVPATVSINDVDCNYEGESLDITLHCTNTEKAQYSYDEKMWTAYTDNTPLTIKPTEDSPQYTTLSLRAENSQGLKTYMKYFFSRHIDYGIEYDDFISFEKPDGWGDTITAYLYQEEDGKTVKEETVEMELLGSLYDYSFEEPWTSAKVVFSDGTNYYPADKKGLEVTPATVYRTND